MVYQIKADQTSAFYINKFTTIKDPNNKRKNLYVDIRYGEINFTFNENKIIMDLKIHIAGDFNLPTGSITADIIMPGETITSLSLFKQNEKIPGGFQYGFADASNLYTGRVILDSNEDTFLSNNINSLVKINLFFGFNTSQLDGVSEDVISSNDLNNFISDIKNTSLDFNLNLYQKNTFVFSSSNIASVNQIKQIWISSDVKGLNNYIISGSQKNYYIPFTLLVNNYIDYKRLFNNIFQIKKSDNQEIKIEIKTFKVGYFIQDQLYETNELIINSNEILKGNIYTFNLTNYQLSYDSESKKYELVKGINGIFVNDNLKGYYIVEFKVTINGSSRTYMVKNNFNFLKNKKIVFSFLESDDLNNLILGTDTYYEIQE